MESTLNNLCNSCTNIGCEFQSGIVRTKCAFYMPPQLEPDNCGNYVVQDSTTKNDIRDNRVKNELNRVKDELEPTTKNGLEVDCIDRQATLDAIIKRLGIKNETYLLEAERVIYQQILAMPSVTPQEPFKPMVEIDLYSVIKQKYIEREVLDKIRAEIEKQEKWLLQAGYNTYNVDIAFNSIKLALAESEKT